MLWDNGIDWNKISNYELFLMIYKSENPIVSKMIFGDVDFQKFQFYTKTIPDKDEDGNDIEKTEITLYNPETAIEISKDHYNIISEYLKAAFNIYPKVELVRGKSAKEWIIDEERQALNNKNEEENHSTLLPLVSSCINHPGFKYKSSELKELGIYQFYDSVKRLQVYEATTSLQKGMYSGFMDSSKIKPEDYNFMKSIQ